MNTYRNSCDDIRRNTLETLLYLEPGLDGVVALGKYFSRVDNKSSTNNYCDLVKDATKCCEKMANTKLWIPIHSLTNLDKLVDQLELNWPKKAVETYQHMSNIFNEIDESYQKKGLKSSKVPGVKQYEPSNDPAPKNGAKTGGSGGCKRGADGGKGGTGGGGFKGADEEHNPILDDPRMKNIDKEIAQRILNEVVDQKQDTKWDDVAGLDNVKQAINEIVVYPMLNPTLFQGLLAPAKGLLLFGPPGTGKTLIGKCIACESGATFFAISASSLTSKWVGEGEKMVRALFAVARCMQPSVIFIDEIDSLLTHRTDGEHDSSRRIKTEFLVQFDGVTTGTDDRLLVVGATNRPQELDDAARRRFTKRLYIPLPEESARKQIIKRLTAKNKSSLTDDCLDYVAEKTAGYSGADMSTLCREVALALVRDSVNSGCVLKDMRIEDLPPISRDRFQFILRCVKPSVSSSDLGAYEEWDRKYGASRDMYFFNAQNGKET